MTHCVSRPSLPITIAGGVAQVHMVPAASDNISWLIEYEDGKVALVDGPTLSPVLQYLERHQLQLTHIFNTHTHGDHIGVNHGLERARETHPHLLGDHFEVWGYHGCASQIPHLTHPLSGGDLFTLGNLQGMCWLTEGHLNGHISLTFWDKMSGAQPVEGCQAALFCGDTLFAAGCGRVFDGPHSAMYQSLTRLATLPTDTHVFCAHEYTLDNLRFALYANPTSHPIALRLKQCEDTRAAGRSTLPSSIGLERETNPFIRAETLDLFIELRTAKDVGAHRES